METIKIENASKKIKDTVIYENIDMVCESGSIVGLIGKNGAGKTMLLKSICGLTDYTGGEISVLGKKIGKDVEIPDSIGVIIEVPGFLPNLSGYKNLKYLADIKGKIGKDRIFEVIRQVGLDPESKKHVGKYSLGMRQRLGIAQALMEDPEILLLDEPMNGLDNKGVADVKEILKDLRKKNKTIILASHHMEDIDELCDKVVVMDSGKIIDRYDK
ncbi:MAG: ATP-binding cassette domain-containing protein [Saccharofermentans sp.]|jgi:ABC-2 type transport system ATP-binding protein|nr:ATP-binding cassette domain-containing protein [Saccharofermentans sp.]